MSDVISVTVPNDAKCIEKARDFLTEMAALSGQSAGSTAAGPATPSAPPAPPAGQSEESGAAAPPPPPPAGGQSEQAGQSEESGASAPPPPPAGDTPDVDAAGLPWDERIHAGTKTKTQAGYWKKKKGVDDATREAVEMQLRHQTASPAGTSSDDGDEDGDSGGEQEAQAPAMSFATFMADVKTRNPSYEAIAAALEAEGLSELPDLATQPDKVQAVYDRLFGDNE